MQIESAADTGNIKERQLLQHISKFYIPLPQLLRSCIDRKGKTVPKTVLEVVLYGISDHVMKTSNSTFVVVVIRCSMVVVGYYGVNLLYSFNLMQYVTLLPLYKNMIVLI